MSSKIVQMEMPLHCEKLNESQEDSLKRYLRSVFGGDFKALFAKENQQDKNLKIFDTRLAEIENVLEYMNKQLDNLCKNISA